MGFLRIPKTLNGYPYVFNDPVNLTDPSGLVGEEEFSEFLTEEFGNKLTLEEINRAARAMSESTGVFDALKLKKALSDPEKLRRELERLRDRLRKKSDEFDEETKETLEKLEELVKDFCP